MDDRPLRKKPYTRCSKVLQIYYTQLLHNFENSQLENGSINHIEVQKYFFFPLLYARKIETDHLNHI